MISVICCYSNREKLDALLMKSLKNQQGEYELVLVDNSTGRFSSAAAALNHGFDESTGEYVVFLHQDILFEEPDFLDQIVRQIDGLNREVIVGAAGIKGEHELYTNITQGADHLPAGNYTLEQPVEVQTLDEVLIAAKRAVFAPIRFDEVTCDSWHLYGTDLCLTAKTKGIASYVIPLTFYHLSLGNVESSYMDTLAKVVAKHKEHFDRIYTTNSVVKTKSFHPLLFKSKHLLRTSFIPKVKSTKIGGKVIRLIKSRGETSENE